MVVGSGLWILCGSDFYCCFVSFERLKTMKLFVGLYWYLFGICFGSLV